MHATNDNNCSDITVYFRWESTHTEALLNHESTLIKFYGKLKPDLQLRWPSQLAVIHWCYVKPRAYHRPQRGRGHVVLIVSSGPACIPSKIQTRQCCVTNNCNINRLDSIVPAYVHALFNLL